nr:PREDICTED: uncharacterized protein LOC109030854 [Bemisia tabaci]
MISAFGSLTLAFALVSSAIPCCHGKSLGQLVEEFEDIEDERRDLLKDSLKTIEVTENQEAVRYLVRLAEAHVTLARLRRYLQAAEKVLYAAHSLRSEHGLPDVRVTVAKSRIENDALRNLLSKLSKIYSETSDIQVWSMPYIVRGLVLPVARAFIHSEEKLLEVIVKFQSELSRATEKKSILLVN